MVRTDSIVQTEHPDIVRDGLNVIMMKLIKVSNVNKLVVNAHVIHPEKVLLNITESLVYNQMVHRKKVGVEKLKNAE